MSAATVNLPALPSSLTPEGNLSRYLSDIRKFPLLEPQEEFMLAKRWREQFKSGWWLQDEKGVWHQKP